jgi:hypothetical protein
MASVPEVESRREVHLNDPKDGRHFGTFLVQLPMGVVPHHDLADLCNSARNVSRRKVDHWMKK